jgi:hypothetical protein
MKKSFLNKKGTIIGDVIGTISNFFSTVPRPVQFIIFLLLILLFGEIINYSLYMFGFFCDGSNNVVRIKLDLTNLVEIPSIMKLQNDLANNDIQALGFIDKDVKDCVLESTAPYLLYDSYGTLRLNRTTEDESRYFYRWNPCVLCDVMKYRQEESIINDTGVMATIKRIGNLIGLIKGVSSGGEYVCLANASGLPYNFTHGNYSTQLLRTSCEDVLCSPPIYYHYDYELNKYVCDYDNCVQFIIPIWNDLLYNKFHATLLYPSGELGSLQSNTTNKKYRPTYNNAIGLTCKDYNPKISIFKINIFDYKLWIAITLIGLCFWAYKSFKK